MEKKMENRQHSPFNAKTEEIADGTVLSK